MSESATIEAQIVPETQALSIRHDQALAPSGLFGTQEPIAIIDKATSVATALKQVITKQGLVSRISGKEYPKCEAWTLLGTMLGVFPVLCWSKPVEGGWEARVEARTRDGGIVGAAEAQCLKSERNWSNRDDFALRSMAQTRATAKCLRMPLGFVMTLAGYEATPAEEMAVDHPHKPEPTPEPTSPPPTTPPAPPPAVKPQRTTGPKYSPPTAATRKWMVDQLDKLGLLKESGCREYFQNVEGRDLLLPNESIADLPLPYVPNCHEEMNMLVTRIKMFLNGERAERAFEPHMNAEVKGKPAKPIGELLPKGPVKDPLWWREVIVPIPRKGQKRADYVGKEDTLGSLFDKRHGEDEESNACRQRLWGFVNHYEPKGWTKKDGTQMPASETDLKFREALDALAKWFEENHRGEKL